LKTSESVQILEVDFDERTIEESRREDGNFELVKVRFSKTETNLQIMGIIDNDQPVAFSLKGDSVDTTWDESYQKYHDFKLVDNKKFLLMYTNLETDF